jgi:hypothetical protein
MIMTVINLYFSVMKYFISMGLDLLVLFTAFIKPQMDDHHDQKYLLRAMVTVYVSLSFSYVLLDDTDWIAAVAMDCSTWVGADGRSVVFHDN